MKHILKLFLLVMFLHSLVTDHVWAQSTVTLDFQRPASPNLKDVQKIKKGDFYQIIIKNLNPNLYSVTLVAEDTILYPPVQLPTFGTLGLPGLSEVLPGGGSLAGVSSEDVNALVRDTIAIEDITPFQEAVAFGIRILRSRQIDFNSLLSEVSDTLSKMEEQLLSVYDSVPRDSSKLYSVDYSASVHSLHKKAMALKNSVADQQLVLQQEALAAKSKGDSILLASTAYKLLVTRQEALYKQITTLSDTLSSSSMRELVKAIYRINRDWEYRSFPIQFNGDQSTVKLKIQPRLRDANVHSFATEFKFPTYQATYTRVGPSFYLSSLTDEVYSTSSLENSTDAIPQWVREDRKALETGLAVMLRHGWRIPETNIGFHVAFGPGVSYTDKVRGRLLFGPGFTFGEEHAISVDIGLIAGNVQQLSTLFNEAASVASATNPTISKLDIQPFLALGYVFRL